MPTGYTYKVSDGTEPSFESFVLRCSRAFGACINQRDSSDEFPNPNLKSTSLYYVDQMKESEEELNKLTNMSDDEIFELAFTEYTECEKEALKQLEVVRNQQTRYAEMLSAVNAWTPPSSEHTGLKTFMLEQLTTSMDADNGLEEYYHKVVLAMVPPSQADISSIREQRMKAARKSYDYVKKHLDEDTILENERRQWIFDLFDNLNVDVVDDKVVPRVEK